MRNSKLEDRFDEEIRNIEKPNIMVVGGTGVGKSSLVNQIFGSNVAKVGSGQPVTKGCHKYEYKSINIFDTEGYEISCDGNIDNSNFTKVVISEIERRRRMELKEQIHLFWYCLSITNHRITDYDIYNIKKLQELGVNLAIVFTKCDHDELDEKGEGKTAKAFKNILSEENITASVFETMAESIEDKLDLDFLIEWSMEKLPTDKLKESFVAAQKHNLPLKDSSADKIIYAASSAATLAAGANPLPLSDALILTPIQVGMAASLAKNYGFDGLGTSAIALLKTQVVSMVGKQMAASLLKLIPGVGNAINGGVAAALTVGMGFGMKHLYRNAYIYYLDNGKEPEWAILFKETDFTSFIKDRL